MEFGRKIKKKKGGAEGIFTFGAAACTLVLLLSLNSSYCDKEAINVSNTTNEDSEDTSSEPFGYFRGSWNLWEFIGDSVSSLFSGF